MIILHKYKLIFIKTTKTAGTSVEVFLSQFAEKNDIVTPIIPPEEGHKPKNYKGYFNPIGEILEERHPRRALGSIKASITKELFFNHMGGIKVKNRIPKEIWNSYYKFAVERNPWDKAVSWYNMVKKRKNLTISFSEFIRKFSLPKDINKYMDVNKHNIILDKIVQYETLNKELKEIFNSKGIEFDSLSVRAKGENKKIQKHYSEYYKNDEDIQIVFDIYKQEIELFDYKFEDTREVNDK